MIVNSYLELTTTLIGWHVANGIAELMTQTGLIFLPLAAVLVRNWAGPMRSQEAKGAAAVSLRRMELDVALIIVIVLFFFLPAVPIQPGNIQYFDTEQDTKVTANNADVPLLKDVEYPNEIRVPLAWWLVHEISSFATKAIVGIIDSMGDPTTLRPILMRVADMKLLEPSLVKEIQNFRSDCYEPALAKFQGLDNTPQIPNQFHDVDWIGSRMFVQTPGFYKKCTNIESCGTGYHARKYQQSWAGINASQSFGSGRPFCDVWWTNPQIGLRTKILNSLSDEHPWLRDAIDKMRSNADEDDSANHGTSVVDYEDRILRRVTTTGPWAMVERADRGKNIKWFSKEIFSINGMQQILASIGTLIVSALSSILMEFIVIGLPMVQALVLMMFYIAVPLVAPFAVVAPSIILRLALILFSLRFVTALWALAKFLDEKLLETMYPNSLALEFGGSGTPADLVLNLITLFCYLILPVLWFMAMSTLGITSANYLANTWNQFSQRAESAMKSGLSTAVSTATSLKSKNG